MKILEKIPGSFSSEVELVEIDGKKFVLKTVDEASDVVSEKKFYDLLRDNGIPVLRYYEKDDLQENQLLLEYVQESNNLAKSFDEKNCHKWGVLTGKMHSIRYDECFRYGKDGGREKILWTDLMRNQIDRADRKSVENNNYGFDSNVLDKIGKYLAPLLEKEPNEYSLIHGDLHTGNIMIRGDELVMIDKNSDSFSGDRLLDLAITWVEMPKGSLIVSNDQENADDRNCLNAFIKGYGEDFMDNEQVKRYVMLITFGRLYTPFAKHYKDIIMSLLDE